MTRSLAVAISFLLASIAVWPQADTAKPKSDALSSAPSSSSPPSSAPSSSGVPDSTKIELVKGERAVYPLAAEEKKLQGQVWVSLHISETGDVEGVDVVSGDPILAAAAVSAIKKWKFKPYIKNGHPVRVLYKMPMDFAFRENVKDTQMPGENSSVPSVDKNPADASSQPPNDPPNGNNVAGIKQVRISQGVSKGLLLLDTLRRRKLPAKHVWLRWTQTLKEASVQAIEAARHCDGFIGCFTLWHKNRMAVEILSPTRLRFSVLSSTMDRRIRAYQQGRRILNWPSTPDNPFEKSLVNEPHVNQMLLQLSSRVTLEGALAISYPDDSELLSVLRDMIDERLRLQFRHSPLLDLGGYNLGTFRRFFAGLSSLCAVHEYLCDEWYKRKGRYPFESAVMVKAASKWISLLADLCSLNESQVQTMTNDLSLGTIKADDY